MATSAFQNGLAPPMSAFVLEPRLAADAFPAGSLRLSLLLVMNDRRFPWAILVPRRPGLVELTDLKRPDQVVLLDEIALVATALRTLTEAKKTNIATLGNEVRQLHIHVVARSENDSAWPAPVWGRGASVPYPSHEGATFAAKLAAAVSARPPSGPNG